MSLYAAMLDAARRGMVPLALVSEDGVDFAVLDHPDPGDVVRYMHYDRAERAAFAVGFAVTIAEDLEVEP